MRLVKDSPERLAELTGIPLAELNAAVRMLEPRDREVLELRFGLGGHHPYTLREIATRFFGGVTKERIRQIETRALRRLRRSAKSPA